MTFVANHDKISQILKLSILIQKWRKRCKIEKIVYDISLIRHFVALTPSWHSWQARHAAKCSVGQCICGCITYNVSITSIWKNNPVLSSETKSWDMCSVFRFKDLKKVHSFIFFINNSTYGY
jgi:hypothetical protein